MWILEKYDDITLKRGIANLEGPIAYLVFLTISINFHKPMSVEYIFSIAGVFTVAHVIYDIKRISTHPLFLMASACLYRDGTACITVQRTKHLSVRFRMLQQRTGITPAVQLA